MTATEHPSLVSLSATVRCSCGDEIEFEDLTDIPGAVWSDECSCGRQIEFEATGFITATEPGDTA